jgi:hypothetical protein
LEGSQTPVPVPFIVGVERSGTTLLRLQLDSHPELAIPPETGVGAVVARLRRLEARPHDLLDALADLPSWRDLGSSREELAAAFEELPVWSLADGLRCYYRLYAARHGKPRWGDKTPRHIEYIEELASLLEEARVLHLIRDGRDVAASVRGLPFAPGDGSIEAIARAWQDRVAAARRQGAAVPHYREVRFERLLAAPEETLRELCDFLDLEYTDALLQSHQRARDRLREISGVRLDGHEAILEESGHRLTARTLSPPDASRVGRWRDALTDGEVRRFEAIAGGTLAALGYERATAAAATRSFATRPPSASGANGPLRVVIGTHAFSRTGGTQTYILTVARELERLGHEPLVAAAETGPMADFAEGLGIAVARSPVELPPTCDSVFAHDAISAAALLERYPDARLVQFAHSDLYDVQYPLLVEGSVDAVVVASERVAARVRALPIDAPIVRLRQPIDTKRFAEAGPLADRPAKALILSNYLRGERYRMLVEAWRAAGIECVQVGLDKPRVDVVSAIGEADIVVGKARAALEAMSCGRAVYIYDQFGGDGWVTPESYPALEADAFGGLALNRTATSDDLVADLALYRPEMGPVNRELIRRHHSASGHAAALVEVLRGPPPRGPRSVTSMSEVARLTRAAWHWEKRSSSADARRLETERRLAQAEKRAKVAEREAARAAERARRAQRDAERLSKLVRTRRVRAGLLLGRALDKVRGSG